VAKKDVPGSFLLAKSKSRGCIDNILRKIICPKIKFEVWRL
jgi:hypothetical protein